jgi:hypothetical protein
MWDRSCNSSHRSSCSPHQCSSGRRYIHAVFARRASSPLELSHLISHLLISSRKRTCVESIPYRVGLNIANCIVALLRRAIRCDHHAHSPQCLPARLAPSSFFVLFYATANALHFHPGHVPDTEAILQQTHRILGPAGRLIVFDADHLSTTFGTPDAQKGREIDFKLASAISTHPDICRQMPLHLKRAGFSVRDVLQMFP